MISKNLNSFKKSPLLAFIKSEPTFLTGSLAVCLSAPVPAFTHEFRSGRQGSAGGRGGGGDSRPRPPAPIFNPGGAPPFPFGYFKTDAASWENEFLAPPLPGVASHFSGKFQAVLNSLRPKA